MGGLQINFDLLGFFDVHPMRGTWAFSHFAPMKMRLPQLGFDPVPSGLAVQHHGHYTTTAGPAVCARSSPEVN